MKRLRVLVLSDEVDRALYDHFDRSMLQDIDLIISCGDLPARYLSFLATMFNGPLLYVCGNHDEKYATNPPEGCICIEDEIFEYQGIRFLGLGGSRRYKKGPFQYTEQEMEKRIRKLWYPLWRKKGFDVLVTHSPAKGHGDGKGAHEGFDCFNSLIEKYQPSWFFYGHMHLSYNGQIPRVNQLKTTTTVNAFGKYVLDLEIPDTADERQGDSGKEAGV